MQEGPEATPRTIAVLPFFASGRFPKADTLGRCHAGGVTAVSGREMVEWVRDLSIGLAGLGMARGHHVALVSESRPEWLIADFAVLAAGAVTVPIYPTLTSEQVAYILRDSDASLAVVSTAEQLDRVLAIAPSAPALRAVVVMDPAAAGLPSAPMPVMSLADVAAAGHRRILDGWGVGREFQDQARRVSPEDLATIIYTSGTTGPPKGVMLTHGNLAANIRQVQQVLSLGPDDVALSFLPLCHAFERMVAYVYLSTGVSMIFAESIDTVARDLLIARPTVLTGVPRVFEKMAARIIETGHQGSGLERRLFDWAMRVADTAGERLITGGRLGPWTRLQALLAVRLVFRRIREGLGGRVRFAVSGSAPLPPEVGRFFLGVGLPVLEGYGLTETAPVLAVNPLGAARPSTVGPPLPDLQIRIADDGEILVRGPNVMAGYYKRPEETAEAMRGGWFHTGDIGALDAQGYLRITDRKKELIVTSGGKKIAPQPIESELLRHALIAEAVVLGDERRFPSALIVPDFTELCRRLNVPEPAGPAAAAALVAREDVRALYQDAIDGVNAHLAQFERIKKFALLPREFSAELGELTPTLKVKRRVVEETWKDVIGLIYR